MKLSRIKISRKTRATLGGVLIAVASLYALSKAYDISAANLFGFLLGSVLLVVATMLIAISLVFVSKKIMGLFRRNTEAPDTDNKKDTFR